VVGQRALLEAVAPDGGVGTAEPAAREGPDAPALALDPGGEDGVGGHGASLVPRRRARLAERRRVPPAARVQERDSGPGLRLVRDDVLAARIPYQVHPAEPLPAP